MRMRSYILLLQSKKQEGERERRKKKRLLPENRVILPEYELGFARISALKIFSVCSFPPPPPPRTPMSLPVFLTPCFPETNIFITLPPDGLINFTSPFLELQQLNIRYKKKLFRNSLNNDIKHAPPINSFS